MQLAKAFAGTAAAFAALASAAPTTVATRDVAPQSDLPWPEHYKAQMVDGFHKARDFILRKPAGGQSDGFQDVLKTKDVDEVIDAWFEHAHGGKQPLLDGYPAELDVIVVSILRSQARPWEDEWEPLTAANFDKFEEKFLNRTVDWNEKKNKDIIVEAESFGFYPHHQSRADILAKLEEMPAFRNYSTSLKGQMRDFLQQPILGSASRSVGPFCRSWFISWIDCELSSLEDAAIHWGYRYPDGLKPEPRTDQLTLFDVFTWWSEKKNITEATIESTPFIDALVAWWNHYHEGPTRPWEGNFYDEVYGGLHF